MLALPNIERSGFRPREYVGYAGARVYRITRRLTGGWVARHYVDGRDVGNPYVFARTLAQLSAKLAS